LTPRHEVNTPLVTDYNWFRNDRCFAIEACVRNLYCQKVSIDPTTRRIVKLFIYLFFYKSFLDTQPRLVSWR
jgi:hypothetical protein